MKTRPFRTTHESPSVCGPSALQAGSTVVQGTTGLEWGAWPFQGPSTASPWRPWTSQTPFHSVSSDTQ